MPFTNHVLDTNPDLNIVRWLPPFVFCFSSPFTPRLHRNKRTLNWFSLSFFFFIFIPHYKFFPFFFSVEKTEILATLLFCVALNTGSEKQNKNTAKYNRIIGRPWTHWGTRWGYYFALQMTPRCFIWDVPLRPLCWMLLLCDSSH